MSDRIIELVDDGDDGPWTKQHLSLLHRDAYLELSFHVRGVLHGIILATAAGSRQPGDTTATHARHLSDNTATLTRHLGHRVMTRDLQALERAGLIVLRARDGERKIEREIERAGDERVVLVHRLLSEIDKQGYRDPPLSLERLTALLAKHPSLDALAEAEKLRDWETHGNGSKRTTKDGIARFRTWLSRSEPSGNGAEPETDYPILERQW